MAHSHPAPASDARGDFDHLNFTELIDLADANATARPIIRADYMITKYRVHEKLLRIAYLSLVVPDLNVTIQIGEFNAAHKFLQHFGDLVQALHLDTSYSFLTKEQLAIIYRDIEQYCYKTLVQLELKWTDAYLMSETKQTFERLIHVSIEQSHHKDNFDIKRIVPNLETLAFKCHTTPALSVVDTYPKLRHLGVFDWGQLNILKPLIKSNPQLESLRLDNLPTAGDQYYIDNNLPNLRTLSILGSSSKLNTNQFTHYRFVENFSISVGLTPLPITFANLRNLTISTRKNTAVLGQMFDQNPHLKVFTHNTDGWVIGYDIIIRHIRYSELEELTINWTHLEEDYTAKLLDATDTLQKVTFVVRDSEQLELLKANLDSIDTWQIVGVPLPEGKYSYRVTVTRREE